MLLIYYYFFGNFKVAFGLSLRRGSSPFPQSYSGKTPEVKMENSPVTVITSSEEEKEEGNGSKEKNIERGVAAKSKLDEYKEISDLTGFDNLKAMILAESIMKRKKKRNRKKKKKDKTKLDSLYREVADLTGFENLKAMIEAEASMRRKSSERMRGNLETQFCARENDTVRVFYLFK